MAKFWDKDNSLYFTDYIEDFSRISKPIVVRSGAGTSISEKDFQKDLDNRLDVLAGFIKSAAVKFDKLPDKVLVNDNVGIVWYKGKKTICKRSKDEQPDPEKAFLWAFYIANCGVSRTKAKKFLKKVLELKDEQTN